MSAQRRSRPPPPSMAQGGVHRVLVGAVGGGRPAVLALAPA